MTRDQHEIRRKLRVLEHADKIGDVSKTFYRWYDLYQRFGEAGLEDRRSHPGRVWNRIPDHVRKAMLEMALARPELSPRELAVTFTDERRYFAPRLTKCRFRRQGSGMNRRLVIASRQARLIFSTSVHLPRLDCTSDDHQNQQRVCHGAITLRDASIAS